MGNYFGQGYQPFTGSSRLGFNRRTWQAGTTIGNNLKRMWYDRKKAQEAKREAKKTIVRKQPLEQRAEQDGTGGSISKFHAGTNQCKLPKSVLGTLASNRTVTNAAGQIVSVIGKQIIYSIDQYFTAGDIATFAGFSGVTNSRVICQEVTSKLLMTNAANTTAVIDIYDVIYRRDVNNATIPNLAQAWIQGDLDQGGAAGSYLVPGVTPFSSKSFTQMGKILKKTHILLAQGQTHQHRLNWNPNKVMDYGLAHYGGQFKGLTMETFVVVHGQVDDAVTGLGGPSIGAAKVNFVSMKEYKSSHLDDSTSTFAAANSLPTAFTGGEDLMDVGTGTAQAYATA